MGEFVRVEVVDGVATIRLDRPKLNALNMQVQDELKQASAQVGADTAIAAVVIYGGERVFAAGADVKEMAEMSFAEMSAYSGILHSCFTAVAKIPKPVIAAVTGYALGGGCELAMCADFRVSGASTKWGQPEILLGIIPGAGGTQRLPRLVGPAKAKEIIFSGRFVGAEEALAIGLVDKVVPDAEVYAASLAWARTYVGGAAQALTAAKTAVDRGIELDLDNGLEIERMAFAALFATADQKIGMRSFVEHGPGKATFTGQ